MMSAWRLEYPALKRAVREPMVCGLSAGGEWIRKFSSAMPRHPPNSVGTFISAVSGGSLGRPNSSIGLPRPTTIRMIPPRRRSIGPNPTEASKPRATARGRRDRVEVRVAFGEHRVKGSAPDGDSESPPRQQAKAHGDRRGAGDRSVFPRGTDSSNPVPSSGECASRSVVALSPPDLARSSSSLDAARYPRKDTPLHRPAQTVGRIASVTWLGGLHRYYVRTA